MVRIAFLLRRANWIAPLGPVILAARGDPEVAPEIALFPEEGTVKKAATADALPAMFRGICPVHTIDTIEEIDRFLRDVDAAVTIAGWSWIFGDGPRKRHWPTWCAVYDLSHSPEPSQRFNDADLAFWPSQHYLELAIRNGVGPEAEMRERARIVGFSRLDQYRHISRDEVRKRNGIDPHRPVVLLIPDSFRFGRIRPLRTNDLYTYVWCVDNPLLRLAGALLKVRTLDGLRLALDPDFGSSAVNRALRRFCDRNGAQLVLAPRRRKEWRDRPYDASELEIADAFIEPGIDFPQSLLQGIAVADLVVCPRVSDAVLEAAGNKTPVITVDMPNAMLTTRGILDKEICYPGIVDWPGVTWLIAAERFVRDFPNRSLADFRLQPEALARYVEQHFTVLDGNAGGRVVDEIKRHVRARPMGAAERATA
jgi:hypothetical protein